MVKITPEAWISEAETHNRRTGRPLVTLTWAQSIDGSLTTQRGEKLALSGTESLLMTHRMRAAHDAIVVGIGTILADDPQLTVRLVKGKDPQPVVLDSQLAFPQQARLIQGNRRPWIATVPPVNPGNKALLEAQGVRILQLSSDPNQRVDLHALLETLTSYGINSIMVEGGARLISGFLSCGLADRVVITISPVLVGGLSVVEGRLKPIPRLLKTGYQRSGDDLIVWGIPKW
jgi:riboflavin-specific deaminase-like protein